MKTKSRRLLSTLLTVMMAFGLFAAFPLTAGAADQGTVMANFAKEQFAAQKAYCLAQLGDAYSTGLCSSFREAFGSAKCVYESFPTGTSDFSTYLLNARAQGADVIFAPVQTEAGVLIFEQADSMGLGVPILAGGTWDSDVILNAAKSKDVDIYVVTADATTIKKCNTTTGKWDVVKQSSAGATLSPTSVAFEKGNSGDITISGDTAGHSPQNIKNGDFTLQPDTDFVINSMTSMTLKAAYLNTLDVGTHTLTFNFSGGTSPTLTITVTAAASIAPTITGPTAMSLTTGYSATSTGAYTVTGDPAPEVTKASGDGKITWNKDTKKLDIAAGLTAGKYEAILKASSTGKP
ncbi:MAG: ABC transporter substrate-binding protein, partial [Clostridiales bacterium]|nr:ABC transporter substrate-binding protein [Clostridiales bacterium]